MGTRDDSKLSIDGILYYIYIYVLRWSHNYGIENLQFPSMESFFFIISDVYTYGNWLFNLIHACAVSWSIIAHLQRLCNIFLYIPCTVMLIHNDLNEYFFVCYPANFYAAFENFHSVEFQFLGFSECFKFSSDKFTC